MQSLDYYCGINIVIIKSMNNCGYSALLNHLIFEWHMGGFLDKLVAEIGVVFLWYN